MTSFGDRMILKRTFQKMLRQWNYREHYHPNLTEEEQPHWDIHAGKLSRPHDNWLEFSNVSLETIVLTCLGRRRCVTGIQR